MKNAQQQLLTLSYLAATPEGTIFASGTAPDNPKGINMGNSGHELRWVARKGGGHDDWAIYTHWVRYDENYVSLHGDKVTNPETIKRLVPCDDEAFAKYRR